MMKSMTGKTFMNAVANGRIDVVELLLSLLEAFPAASEYDEVLRQNCERCGEPASQPVCALCQLSAWFARPGRAPNPADLPS